MAQIIKQNSRNSSNTQSSISKPPIKPVDKSTEAAEFKRGIGLSSSKRGPLASKFSRSNKPPSVSSQYSCQLDKNPTASDIIAATASLNKFQPSKIFAAKSKAEFESLLNSIKDIFNEEIASIHGDNIHADLCISIGDSFRKSLHKCLVRARAYKFLTALEFFFVNREIDPREGDIVVSEFQDRNESSPHDIPELEQNRIETNEGSATDLEANDQKNLEGRKLTHSHPSTQCRLPENLTSPELLLSFSRRIYLDQDISDEENKLQQILVEWLKSNRPELVKSSDIKKKHLPDHRESFRTIQPDFDDRPIRKSPNIAMSQEGNLINLADEIGTNNADDQDEINSQTTSIRDESLTGSLLTRTETFELISKSIPNSPSINNLNKSTPPLGSSEDNQIDESLNDESENNEPPLSPSAFAPTTRTGLKPKTFTVPSSVKAAAVAAAKASVRSQQNKSAAKSGPLSRTSHGKVTATPISFTKTPANRSTAEKRPSLTNSSGRQDSGSSLTSTPPESRSSSAIATGKVAKSTGPSNAAAKTKPALIARAHPISLERSQSPSSTSSTRNGPQNFIAANKKSISQIEKRPTQLQEATDHQPVSTSSEVVDQDSVDWAVFESLSVENLSSHLDKFALVSYSKLADALSRMFIDGTMSDATLVTNGGRTINAHKCILAARSIYFAEIIKKLSLPSAAMECSGSGHLRIDLSEFSYSAVYFALIHIYTGAVKVPDNLELEELAKITHLLHVTTLKQVCAHNLRMNYCHFFHKPCSVCLQGVLKALPLAWRYDYSDLYSKCLNWIGNNFANVFCLKEFSELKPNDLIEECYSATLNLLTPENIIPKTIECQKLLKSLPRVKWTESIICLVGRQLEDFCHYVADNYEKILQSESFLNLSKNCWECEVLEENLLAAMNHLKPDSGCRTLIELNKIECSIESYCEDPRNASDSFVSLISKMRKYCERYLLKEATAVVHCSSWRQMNPSLQKRIKDQAILSSDFDEPSKQLASKPKLPSMSRVSERKSPNLSSLDQSTTRSPSNRSTPDSNKKSPAATYLPQPKTKTASARHVKVLK